MDFERIKEKLAILADAAKYDVSCSSSGSTRRGKKGELGNAAPLGICHSFTEDGRCISLLKILLTNHCIYDCVYCVSRRSNDIARAAFSVQEVVDLTINFYRRNYIEGLFLSSGVFKDADTTMERLVRVAKKLREEEHFNGYIHLKTIPGASELLIHEAGLYADFGMQVYYALAAIYGLLVWRFGKKHGQQTEEMPITHVGRRMLLPSLLFFVVAWGMLYWILAHLTNSTVPVLDSFGNALSFVGLWWLARKYLEQWCIWAVVDTELAALYAYKGLPFTAILYALYVLIAVAGYHKWKQSMPRQDTI